MSVGFVLVPVVVRSGAGFAKNLDKKDFQLRVEGKPVAIESFERRSDAPASIVLLQDLSGSMANGGKLEESREALRFFLDKALPGDELAIATFASDLFEVEVPFTQDQAALREASDRWRAYGTTALHDAVARMPQISLEGRNPKRFALLITDGVDNASHLTPEAARAVVQEAHLPTYVLGLGAGQSLRAEPGREEDLPLRGRAEPARGRNGRALLRRSPTTRTSRRRWRRSSTMSGTSTCWGSRPATDAARFRPLTVEVKKSRDRQTVVFRRGYKGSPPAEPRAGG